MLLSVNGCIQLNLTSSHLPLRRIHLKIKWKQFGYRLLLTYCEHIVLHIGIQQVHFMVMCKRNSCILKIFVDAVVYSICLC